jgi:demethylmenaquinone methyltransferase/2-methoxy-6-polyprenyl-1,4-benzoquinol methylase
MNGGFRKIYSEISDRYELINHILTFGLDVVCRGRAARLAASGGGTRWLDVCSGTGDMVVDLQQFAQNGTAVFAADFSAPMLHRAAEKPGAKGVKFLMADAGTLPFGDETFDLVTISFATRNINSSRQKLIERFGEFHRVLKPGGRFVNLETSQPRWRLIRSLMHLYVRLTVKPIGSWISGTKSGYAYLAGSIPRFYSVEELAEILHQAGFAEVSFKRMYMGITAVHKATKR